MKIHTPIRQSAYTTKFHTQDSCDKAFWLSCYVKTHSDVLMMVVTNDQSELNQLETELAFFGIDAHVFSDYETLVYDQLLVHQDIISDRIGLLTDMPTSGVLLVSMQTLMQRIVPPQFLLGRHFDLSVGATFDLADERTRLTKAGYRAVDNVFEPGEFAVRGSVVDIFAMGQALPFRLDLFDDEIESIRFFNPETQRTLSDEGLAQLKKDAHTGIGMLAVHKLPELAKVDRFSILPAREFDLQESRELFRQNFASMFADVSARKFELYNDVMEGVVPAGIEYYMPLFFDLKKWQEEGTLFSYLPQNTLVVTSDELDGRYDEFFRQVKQRYEARRHDKDKPILAPAELYLSKEALFGYLKKYPKIMFGVGLDGTSGFVDVLSLSPPSLAVNHQLAEPLQLLLDFIYDEAETKSILLVAESAGRREILLELLKGKINVELVADFEEFYERFYKTTQNKQLPTVALTVASIERGLWLGSNERHLCVISETQIFGRQVLQTRRRRQSSISQAFLVKSVTELNEGSLVVHIEHGIGRYQGLMVLDVGEGEQEFIHLKYADDASVYVPIANLALIGRYSGTDSEAVALSKLGSGKWNKAKEKALTQIYDVAAELLNVQARRAAKLGISFPINMAEYELFASGFAFEETFDQALAIESVLADMKQTKPMDRLICGDVGFGKTEVAMRAAFVAVSAGYQVAVLVPTTLLAGQHEDSFRSRFADWAVRIESLSRFSTKKAQDKVLAELADGQVDIVIGTHKLLQDDVKFKNLGLMIVDEEHRFGVRHKEKIKAMQSDVDSLSMTATPIPRTLNMALSGMQDISIIATPPARRLAIKTFVMPKSNETITDAILREILRGGQVYFLHNDVASIETMAETLRELVAEARVGVAHGQMNEKELSAVMSDFYHKKFNVLVASTIIETGIDVPNANTIIINRADKFGLAQLHQLRGRVGRSHHQAYCYLLVPSIKGLTADAKKRLDAITKANTLGAGFMLASEDLEIRGAGEILGKEQSGNMQTIGFGLYMDMLERATRAIKAGKTPSLATPLDIVSDINIHASALIPDDYLGDVHERLMFYKRISSAADITELNDLRVEMIDRFGALPTQGQNLFAVHRLRIKAEPLGIIRMDISASAMTFEFRSDTVVDAMAIIRLIQSEHKEGVYRMNGATGLKFTAYEEMELSVRLDRTLELLSYFAKNVSSQVEH
ncbi:MAG: transcription-repair coupling factor [Moraxella sp.]|uniref:transcription-repair coupling factor n=1 Tax=Moraxella sp. TaxID=479 RepID=UPI0026DCB580|nr:transcription-repair coupling factor [Moraxella sp.]MDO4449390.1 transcription-repair coupling factor [Moraxella sp.]